MVARASARLQRSPRRPPCRMPTVRLTASCVRICPWWIRRTAAPVTAGRVERERPLLTAVCACHQLYKLRLWPQLHREPGPFVWSGNCVPDSTLRMGCAFRLELQTESASRNPRLEWDTLSGTALNRKLQPGIDAQNGMRFPNRLQAEIASHSESSFWDTLSARSFVGKAHPIPSAYSGTRFPVVVHLEIAPHSEHRFRDAVSAGHAIWKAHPILSTQSGTWFPRVLPTGKCVPVW